MSEQMNFIDMMRARMGTLSVNNVLQWENVSSDIITFINYYQWYTNIALRTFKWDFGDDESLIDSTFIEKLLFWKGACAIVDDDTRGHILCAFTNISQNYNYFGYPTRIQAYDVFNNGKVIGDFDDDKFVIIPNNMLWYPTNLIVLDKANKISNMSEAIDINIDGQKHPVVFQGTPEQKETMKQMSAKYIKGERPLYVPKEFNVNDITCLNPDVPFKALELYKAKDSAQSELLTMLGINNINISKESGVNSDEISSNDALVQVTFDSFRDVRMQAVNELQNKFGMTVELEYNNNVNTDELYKQTIETISEV